MRMAKCPRCGDQIKVVEPHDPDLLDDVPEYADDVCDACFATITVQIIPPVADS